MDQLRTINTLPRSIKAVGLATTLVLGMASYNIYNSNKQLSINCLSTSLEYKKGDPKIEEARKKGMEIKTNPNGTFSLAFTESVIKDICGQKDVQGISTSGNSELEQQIKKALGQNATEKEKLNKRLEKAGGMIEDTKDKLKKTSGELETTRAKMQELEEQLQNAKNGATPPKKK